MVFGGLQYFQEPLYLGNDRMKSRTLNGTSPSFEILRLFLHLSYLCLRAHPLEANRMIGDRGTLTAALLSRLVKHKIADLV